MSHLILSTLLYVSYHCTHLKDKRTEAEGNKVILYSPMGVETDTPFMSTIWPLVSKFKIQVSFDL